MLCDICSSPLIEYQYRNRNIEYYVCKKIECFLKVQHILQNDNNFEGWTQLSQKNEYLSIQSQILQKTINLYQDDFDLLDQQNFISVKLFDCIINKWRKEQLKKFQNELQQQCDQQKLKQEDLQEFRDDSTQLSQTKTTQSSNLIMNEEQRIFGCYESEAILKYEIKINGFPQEYFLSKNSNPEQLVSIKLNKECIITVYYWHLELENEDQDYDLSLYQIKQEMEKQSRWYVQQLERIQEIEIEKIIYQFEVVKQQPFKVQLQKIIKCENEELKQKIDYYLLTK